MELNYASNLSTHAVIMLTICMQPIGINKKK